MWFLRNQQPEAGGGGSLPVTGPPSSCHAIFMCQTLFTIFLLSRQLWTLLICELGGGVWFIGLWARVSTSSFVSQIFAASSLDDGIILFFTIAERAQTHKHTHIEKSPQPSVIYESIEDIRGQICWIRLLSPAWTLSSVHSAFESQSCHFLSDRAAPYLTDLLPSN